MNIIIANTQEFNPQIGGVEKVSNVIAEKLSDNGHSIYFVACLISKYTKEKEIKIKEFILPLDKYFTKDNIKEFSRIISHYNIHLIINQAGNIYEFTKLCSFVSKINNIKMYTVIHTDPFNKINQLEDFGFSVFKQYRNIKALVRMIIYPFRIKKVKKEENIRYEKIYNMSDKVIFLSDSYKNIFKKNILISEEIKLMSIPNPILIPIKYNTCLKEKTILYVGRLDYIQKRIDRMINIWKIISKKMPEWKLEIVGDGPEKKLIYEYIKKNKINNISLHGFKDPTNYYLKAEIICLTSTIEGLPMAILEGMCYGCIPIAYNSFDAVNDIIEDNKNGYIIKKYNKREYIKKLLDLMNNNKRREYFRSNLKEIIEKYNINTIINKWESIL